MEEWQKNTNKTTQAGYLKRLEILGQDISKLGKSVLVGLFVLFQDLLDTSPQDDHDLQQTGRDGHVFAQQRFSLLRTNSQLDLRKLRHTEDYDI